MRGQKSRSGSGTRPGFQGGQTPLYRQMPKLRGIAGGAAPHTLTQCACRAGLPLCATLCLCKAKALQRAVPFLFCVLTSIQGPPFSRALYSNTSGHAVAGMSAGVPKYVTINLGQLAERFSEGEEVSLATLKAKRVLNLSGKEAKLPLKVRPKPAV